MARPDGVEGLILVKKYLSSMIIDYPCYTLKCSVVFVQEQSVRIVILYAW